MNKSDLIQQLQSNSGLTKAQAQQAVDTLFSPQSGIISQCLKGGQKLTITGFGSFTPKRREARVGRNPRTGKQINIGASTSASFRAGKGLKDSLSA